MKDSELMNTMDAKVWAEEFVKQYGGDAELMLAWFGTAIMCGDNGGRRYDGD